MNRVATMAAQKLFAVGAAVAIVAIGQSPQVSALSCHYEESRNLNPKQQLQEYSYVFLGTVIEHRQPGPGSNPFAPLDSGSNEHRVRVQQWIKGGSERHVAVSSDGTWGTRLDVGYEGLFMFRDSMAADDPYSSWGLRTFSEPLCEQNPSFVDRGSGPYYAGFEQHFDSDLEPPVVVAQPPFIAVGIAGFVATLTLSAAIVHGGAAGKKRTPG